MSIFWSITTAIWLGILTSISPCPLASNIVAVSFIGKKVDDSRYVLLSGLLYSLGRAVTYMLLAVLLISGIFSIPSVSIFLQKYMNEILGPLLILVGMFLLELIQLNFNSPGISEHIQEKAKKSGLWGAGLLGVVFALSFCPVSAAIFFGSLIPLSIKSGSKFLLPSLYGIGTALPVILFSFLISFGAKSIGKVYNKLTVVEKWARYITGTVFILIGIFYCLRYIFKVI
ncbi:MAG: aromatic aminobenezylarsenical efflux permease ArsG family transporter [Candidatus Eremiobacteraeota bacterium]|nr:aromatic aminobenezylarsenical efflux permease ArsG family transporter [Candidatus Eremiobacteraeota bacterium]